MKWESFAEQFDESWHEKIRPFIESEECDKIYAKLKSLGRRGVKIAPLSFQTFRAFRETPLYRLKVVMMGMAPYHTFMNGLPVADGLLMGCSVTGKLQPSLDQFYGALERELYDGLQLNAPKHSDVSYLANQGVLMLNASLTVEKDKPGSHIPLWEPFIKYLFEEIINVTGVPIIFLGKDAAKYQKYTAPMTWTFTLSHPASAAYKHTEWDSEGVFKKINMIIKQNNNLEIDWLDVEPPF
jgi:uracil-DNA glycosylase